MKQCPNCQRDNPEDAAFCNQCGTRLADAPAGDVSAVNIGQGNNFERNIRTQGGDVLTGDKIAGDKIAGDKVQVIQVVQSPSPKALSLPEALRRYLDNLIDTHQHLRLQGIRAGSQPLSIELEKVYISLTAVEKHLSPRPPSLKGKGEPEDDLYRGSGALTIGAAMQRYERLVITGDRGCG